MENNLKCPKCKTEFKTRSHLNRHFNNKYDCITGKLKTDNTGTVKCELCGTIVSRHDNLISHQKTKLCAKKAAINNKLNNMKGNAINDGNSNTQNNITGNDNTQNSNNITNNTTNNNIMLVCFGKDGTDCISKEDCEEIFDSKTSLLEGIIKNVNLNPKKPQHHNFYYGDLKSAYGEIYEDNKWSKMKINEMCDKIITAKAQDLRKIFNGIGRFFNKKLRKRIDDEITDIELNPQKSRKKLISYMKPLIFNSKKMLERSRYITKTKLPIKTRSQVKAELSDDDSDDDIMDMSPGNLDDSHEDFMYDDSED